MQKKINREPKKAFLPGHLAGEATLPPPARGALRRVSLLW
jgi:hypothetical protein